MHRSSARRGNPGTAQVRGGNLRRALAQEAARIMAQHGIQDFLTAKRKAADRLRGDLILSCPAEKYRRSRRRWQSISDTVRCAGAPPQSRIPIGARRCATPCTGWPSSSRVWSAPCYPERRPSTPTSSCTCLPIDRRTSRCSCSIMALSTEITEAPCTSRCRSQQGLPGPALRPEGPPNRGHRLSARWNPTVTRQSRRRQADATRRRRRAANLDRE